MRAATAISDAAVDGDELHSTQLVFSPETIRGGDYHFAVGTAGSCLLVLQTILLPLLQADEPSTVVLEGGTHNPFAPPFDFLEQVFLPLLRRMGADVEIIAGALRILSGRRWADRGPDSARPELTRLELREGGVVVRRQATALVVRLSRDTSPGGN